MVRAPSRAEATAAAIPAGPPPTTSTSHSAWTGMSRAASRTTLPVGVRLAPRGVEKISEVKKRRPPAAS